MRGLVPMNDSITIERTVKDTANEWGALKTRKEQVPGIRCNIRHNTEMKKIATANGDEVVFSATILLEPTVELFFDDTITFTDSRGNSYRKAIISIQDKRTLKGTPVLTRVVV